MVDFYDLESTVPLPTNEDEATQFAVNYREMTNYIKGVIRSTLAPKYKYAIDFDEIKIEEISSSGIYYEFVSNDYDRTCFTGTIPYSYLSSSEAEVLAMEAERIYKEEREAEQRKRVEAERAKKYQAEQKEIADRKEYDRLKAKFSGGK